MKTKSFAGTAAMMLAGFHAAAPALAQEKTSGIQPLEWVSGNTTIRIYGQIDEGALSFDDGEKTTNYGLVGNKNSSSRLGLRTLTALDSGWDMTGNFEFEYVPHGSTAVDQTDPDEADYDLRKTNIRKMELAFSSDRYGKFWLGQGSMASDGSAKSDLSGTTVIASAAVADIGGGLFRMDDGVLSDISTSDAYSDYNGLGRKMRVRYDSPSFNGFRIMTSFGQDVLAEKDGNYYDIAAHYQGDLEAFDLEGGLAYSRKQAEDIDILSGSVSGLHKASGLNLTLAAAQESAAGDGSYGYVKLGWKRDFFAIGTTALSLDYYTGDDVVEDGSDSQSYGVAMVQRVDRWNTDWYLGLRNYDYDDDTADYQDGLSTMIGFRVQF
ncbi:porin [Paracoccus sp. XHP0099]|uniref:Porin n=2 Tax=Paracoccus marinaquae TaxID=2841926 RepID=A0ABS6AKD4_9RHOB|nr:porin [Paracoccus marinaquae]